MADEGEHGPADGVGQQGLDVGGFVRRARRLADLSQRDLAGRIGMAQGTVSAIETGVQDVSIGLFERILREAGLHLAVVDHAGAPVVAMFPYSVRDNGGRRLPAHLGVGAPERLPYERGVHPHPERQELQAWFEHRGRRDRRREKFGDHLLLGAFPDHPTPLEMTQARLARIRGGNSAARRVPVQPTQECICDTECWLGTTCVPDCECQCEPGWGGGAFSGVSAF